MTTTPYGPTDIWPEWDVQWVEDYAFLDGEPDEQEIADACNADGRYASVEGVVLTFHPRRFPGTRALIGVRRLT